MPRGKSKINGYVLTAVNVTDCANLKKLEKCRIRKLPPLTKKQVIDIELSVNTILSRYMGAMLAQERPHNKIVTHSIQVRAIRKLKNSARKFEVALKKGIDPKPYADALREALSIKELGAQTKDLVHKSAIFYKNNNRIGDIFRLEKGLARSSNLGEYEVNTLKLLFKMALPAKPKKGARSLANPLWQGLVLDLAKIWTLSTGRKATPATAYRVYNEDDPDMAEKKTHLFYEWVEAVILMGGQKFSKKMKNLIPPSKTIHQIIQDDTRLHRVK